MKNESYTTIHFLLDHLSDAKALNLPSAPNGNEVASLTVEIRVASAEFENIRAVAGGKELNVLKLFLTGIGILLWKYTAQEEIIVSVPPLMLNENVDDIEENGILYCKLNPSEEIVVNYFLGKVHESLNAVYQNGKYNSKEFKEQFFSFHNSLAAIQGVGFCYNKLNYSESCLNKHALVFELEENENDTVLKVRTHATSSTEHMLRNLGESLLWVVSNLSENKNKTLGAIDVVTKENQAKWEKQFIENIRDYPKEYTVVDLFKKALNTDPNKTALLYGDKNTSYKELDEQSECIAQFVNDLLGGKAGIIGLMIDRSPVLVATMLGILRAGSAYLPFDKEYPLERMRGIALDAGCKIILTDTDEHPDIAGCKFINVSGEITNTNSKKLVIPKPNDLAYVIYSSGTTGKPKGIMIEHAAIINLLYFYNERYNINENTRIVQLTNCVIDIAFQEIFSALVNGLTLYIPLREESRDKDRFIQYLEEHRINFIQLIPDMLSVYLQDIPKLPYLEQILCGGDKLSDNLKDAIVAKGYTLYNVYGQTETAIDTVGGVCIAEMATKFNDYVPNYDVFILDEFGNFCPEYVPGEICTGGEGLARGYLNNPGLTAQKFVPHPFKANVRIYKTGDMGRRFPDGSIELLGRKDDQVKIRGYRIELSEIEHALEAHPEIESAVVKVFERSVEKDLVAYYISKSNLDIASIRSYLLGIKPSYMLPSHYLRMDKFPLNAGGKVDRKKLPRPDGSLSGENGVFVAPRNETERRIIQIWKTILAVEKVGITDSFFEIGGDSIKILRLMTELRKQLRIKVSFADIYKNSTIEQLMAHLAANGDLIEEQNRKQAENKQVIEETFTILKSRIVEQAGLSVNVVEDIYPMSDIEKGIVYESVVAEGTGVYHDIAVHRRIFPDFEFELFRQALSLLTEKHEVLRSGFNLDEYGTEVQIVYMKIEPEITYQQLSGDTAEQELYIVQFVQAEIKRPFRFTAPPLWRINVFDAGNQEVVIITQSHHSIMDGWSDALFMTELNNIYLALSKDAAYRPEKLRSTYRDFVIEQELDKRYGVSKGFWKTELDGYTRLDLFTETLGNDSAYKRLDNAFVQEIEELASELNTTFKVITLSAYIYMLGLLGSETEILAGLVTNARPDCEDSDKLIGCFLNTIPLRMLIDENISSAEFISSVQNKMLELKSHERLSMLEISTLHEQQYSGGNPFFDVIFNYVDFHAYNSLQQSAISKPEIVSSKVGAGGYGQTNTYFDFDVDRTGGGCFITLRLDRQLRCSLAAENIGDLFCRIIEEMISNPTRKLKEMNRILPTGLLQLADCKEGEVKIKGNKVVLSEIENVLLGYEKIQSTVVIARSERGIKKLVAYITGNEELDSSEMRTYLSGRLPDYLIPDIFIALEQFPLNAEGEINRKELAAMSLPGSEKEKEYVAPGNEIEKRLVQIWEEILGKKNIGVTDNFFELGGHSLKVIMILSRINKAFNIKVDVNVVFKDPTILSLAKYIEAVNTIDQESTVAGDELIF